MARPPGRLEAPAGGVVLDVLEAGQLVREGAHVAAALDVVLSAQRIEPGAVAADVSGQQGDVDQRQHVVGRVVVLRDPEGPAELRAIRRAVGVRQLADGRCRHARQPLGALEGVVLDGGTVLLEADGRAFR